MKTFISETLDGILQKTSLFTNVVFVLPSQRAGVFIKQQLKEKITVGFLPKVVTIGEFIETISEINKADSIQLLFDFYTIYKQQEKQPVSFEVFSSWAFTVLQDFNEIDQHLVNTKDIFAYLKDIERLRKWSVEDTLKETDLMKGHFSFLEKMNDYYTAFYKFLLDKQVGYQGLIYREATKKVALFIDKNPKKQIIFIGFNALNKAEEFLFQEFLSAGNTKVFWDIDTAFLHNNHQAGTFIRKYQKEWHFYEKNPLALISNTFSSVKKIEIIGASKNITQVKYVGEVLKNIGNFNNTALVLADETLLPVTLNSLPKNINRINITMGYPLKDIPVTNLIENIFLLFLTQEKLQKTKENTFYHKDVHRFLKHPFIFNVIQKGNTFFNVNQQIAKENSTFLSDLKVADFLTELEKNTKTILLAIFNPYKDVVDFINRILQLITLLKDKVSELEKEYLFRLFRLFTQLQNLQTTFQYFENLQTLSLFFKQLTGTETLSFKGEPLQGLQLMGMLETRVLDFENVIITSVNEGILPQNSMQNSFIPFDVKLSFGLPTYKEKDAIFSYHFFRLLQRAKNIYLLYNTEPDTFGNGEKSRFITQLEMLKKDEIEHKTISPKVITKEPKPTEIVKNKAIISQIKTLAEKGISPSTITGYLHNPISFYKQKILKIKDFKKVEETIATNTMGTVIHETLKDLYTPFLGEFLTQNDVLKMKKNARILVTKHFKNEFKNGDINTGKNRLIFEVANRFIQNFLTQEQLLLSVKENQLKIIAIEKKLSTQIHIEGFDFPITLHGEVDRIDELNGVTRIIDYKTGKVESRHLKINDIKNITEEKHRKALQVLFYTFLYRKSTNTENKPIEAGIISFKNLKSGFLKLNSKTKNPKITEELLSEFLHELKEIIKTIFNSEISFIEPEGLRY